MGKHQRITEQLQDYWNGLRTGNGLPREAQIDPDALEDIWPFCFLVKVESRDGKPLFRYSYLGASLIDAFGEDVTNEEVSALMDASNPPLVRQLANVAKDADPHMEDNEFTNRRGIIIKYRSVLLPVAGEDGTVQYILGGMKWRAY